jgi:hypothetical protein
MSELRKPATSGKSAGLAAQRKSRIAAKTVPTAEVPAVDDPSLFSLEAEAKEFAARVDSGFQSSLAKLESVTPSIEATEPKPKAAVGPPGAQGLPGAPGLITVSIKTAAEYAALTPEQQADPTIWYVIPKTP